MKSGFRPVNNPSGIPGPREDQSMEDEEVEDAVLVIELLNLNETEIFSWILYTGLFYPLLFLSFKTSKTPVLIF